jgi:hypothetical protein
MRPTRCMLGLHTWTDWTEYKDGCGDPGCDHYLRHCVRCPKWQHKTAGDRPRRFKWGGLYERGERP